MHTVTCRTVSAQLLGALCLHYSELLNIQQFMFSTRVQHYSVFELHYYHIATTVINQSINKRRHVLLSVSSSFGLTTTPLPILFSRCWTTSIKQMTQHIYLSCLYHIVFTQIISC